MNIIVLSGLCLLPFSSNSAEMKTNSTTTPLPTETQLTTELTQINKSYYMPTDLAKIISEYAHITKLEISYFKDELHEAVTKSNLEKVNEIISRISSFNIQNIVLNTRYRHLYRSHLEWAIKFKNINIINALIQAGSNVNAINFDGKTSLMCVILQYPYENQKNVVKLLIEAGANLNTFDPNYNTALTLAVLTNKKEIVKILIDNDVDVKFSTPNNSALGICITLNLPEIAQMLIAAGANVNECDLQNRTHLANAIRLGRKEIVEMLRKANASSK